jgi:hypothetical protein
MPARRPLLLAALNQLYAERALGPSIEENEIAETGR